MCEQKEKNVPMEFFDLTYQSKPPWDIDRPQREYIQLEQAGEIVGSVLDVGCGTGENALYLAAHGHEVWGIDFTPTAIQKARERAAQRHLTATFRVLNVLELPTLGRTFDTVIDSGLFHVLTDEKRPLFVDNLAAVIRRGGTYFMLCFSEFPKIDHSNLKDFLPDQLKDFLPDQLKDLLSDPDKLNFLSDPDKFKEVFSDPNKFRDVFPYGPIRVTQAEIRALFRDGWRINYIRQATLEEGAAFEQGKAHAWLSSISKE
jgi:SAM-dependent methyltransferase